MRRFDNRGGGGRFGGGGPRRGGSGGYGGGGGRRDFGRPSFSDIPLKVGEEYDVEITDVGAKGDGITRVKNFVVFVPNTQKGDKVHIIIKELRGRSAIAEVAGSSEEEDGVTEEGVSEEVETEEESTEEEM